MIIDQVPLSGDAAYLRVAGDVNLVAGLASSDETVSAATGPLGEGHALQLAAVHLLIEGDDLDRLFERQERELLALRVRKELFPDLFADPYAHRVHTLAGADDFRRGVMRNCDLGDVDGRPTLVSVGSDDVTWRSATYRLPEPVRFTAAAWDVPAVTLAHPGAFTYSLTLEGWTDEAPSETPFRAKLADEVGPDALRRAEALIDEAGQALPDARAFRVVFRADVRRDAALFERTVSSADAPSRGRPLLSAVHLLERREPVHAFRSLRELTLAATDVHLFSRPPEPTRRMLCTVPVPATLTRGEGLEIEVRGEHFTRVEARLQAAVFLRPPALDAG